ncbi:MAG: hypothetical protein HQM01_07725 [Magnetococcales bacterium]|nr:hypothetical protein [Magnetococcales bacterium]
MSDALLSTIRALTRSPEAARVSSVGGTQRGRAGDDGVPFRGFMPENEPAKETEVVSEAPVSRMTGSAGDLAALGGRLEGGAGSRFGQQDAALASLESEPEAWTFVAPSVAAPTPTPASRLNANASFKIYARAADHGLDPSRVSVIPEERNVEKRR